MSGFSQILNNVVDFLITLKSFNMKQKVATSYTSRTYILQVDETKENGAGFIGCPCELLNWLIYRAHPLLSWTSIMILRGHLQCNKTESGYYVYHVQ
ncbi:hypothetical protein C5167_016375 [Papaver somniferum]|nr:hypothetical protein C5167_016375 [Papaver somniferum]